MDKIKKYFNDNKTELYFITILTIIAFVIRLVAMNNIGELAYDEIASWYFASKKSVFDTVLSLIREDVNMPLYFVILHFWIKLFGDSEKSMHLCSLIATIPLIPLSFYLMKSLFNKTSAYFASVLFALNTFCIYYSMEVNFFALVILLSLLVSFAFVKMLEKFEKKYVIAFTILHTLLFYTFSLVPILSLFYLIVGFSYVLIKKRNIRDFALLSLLNVLLCLPALVFVIYNVLILNSNFVFLAHQTFDFNWCALCDIMENFFSYENSAIINKINTFDFDNFQDKLNIGYVVFVVVPVLISIFVLLKAFLAKNLRLNLFVLPSFLAFVYVLLLASANAIYFQTKYLLMVFPVFVCCMAFGISLIRNKALSCSLFVLIVYLSAMHLVFSPANVYNLHNVNVGNINSVLNNIADINDGDYILSSFYSNKLKMYINKGNMIPFAFDEALILKDKASVKFYFGEELLSKLNKDNIKSKMKEYIVNNKIPDGFRDNMSNYLNKMKKGDKFILISAHYKDFAPIDLPFGINEQNYDSVPTFELLVNKALRDAKKLADENLKFVKKYDDEKRNYSIYIYEKN